MNEKKKMLSGLLYNPNLDGLFEERVKAKELCYKYNSELNNNYIKSLFW